MASYGLLNYMFIKPFELDEQTPQSSQLPSGPGSPGPPLISPGFILCPAPPSPCTLPFRISHRLLFLLEHTSSPSFLSSLSSRAEFQVVCLPSRSHPLAPAPTSLVSYNTPALGCLFVGSAPWQPVPPLQQAARNLCRSPSKYGLGNVRLQRKG